MQPSFFCYMVDVKPPKCQVTQFPTYEMEPVFSIAVFGSFLATFLLSLENLSFVQASIAMLDVYSLAFMLLPFWLYLKGRILYQDYQ